MSGEVKTPDLGNRGAKPQAAIVSGCDALARPGIRSDGLDPESVDYTVRIDAKNHLMLSGAKYPDASIAHPRGTLRGEIIWLPQQHAVGRARSVNLICRNPSGPKDSIRRALLWGAASKKIR